MKSLAVGVLIIAATLAMPWDSLSAQGIRQERVSFHAGASSTTVSGSIKGDEIIDYKLDAKAGQTMSVSMKTSSGANYFNVLPPGSDAAIANGSNLGNQWTGTLPVDGDYTVRVYLMRSAARRNETAKYTLTVGITGTAGSTDAKVAGTPYHATGQVPCSVGPDPKGSAQCSFGVIRGAPGEAEVRLAPPGYDVTLHADKVDSVLIFRGNTVTSPDPAAKVAAEKKGDDWLVGVNSFHFYTIPEAVIVGGRSPAADLLFAQPLFAVIRIAPRRQVARWHDGSLSSLRQPIPSPVLVH